jgi:methionine-rich copper-binding protein CopC
VIRTKGTLYTGSKISSDLSPLAGGFNLTGNPYQSPVDMGSVLNASSNVNTSFYHVWDPTINTRGGYVAVDLSSNINTVVGSLANRYLQPGQGFFFQTLNTGTASINFKETDKAIANFNGSVFKNAATLSDNIRITLYESNVVATNATAIDGLVIKFNSSYSNKLDSKDAPKMINQDEDFAIRKGVTNLSIESRDWPVNNEAISLYIDKYRFSNYTIKADIPSLNNLRVYLHDKYTGKRTELIENSTVNYSFSVSVAASKLADRFELLFAERLLSTANPEASASSGVYPNPSQGVFYYNLPQGFGTADVKIYNVLGQEIRGFKSQINNTVLEVDLKNKVSAGNYYVRYTVDGKTIVKKIIIGN